MGLGCSTQHDQKPRDRVSDSQPQIAATPHHHILVIVLHVLLSGGDVTKHRPDPTFSAVPSGAQLRPRGAFMPWKQVRSTSRGFAPREPAVRHRGAAGPTPRTHVSPRAPAPRVCFVTRGHGSRSGHGPGVWIGKSARWSARVLASSPGGEQSLSPGFRLPPSQGHSRLSGTLTFAS